METRSTKLYKFLSTHTSKQLNSLVLLHAVVQNQHGECVGEECGFPIEDEAQISSRPLHFGEIPQRGI